MNTSTSNWQPVALAATVRLARAACRAGAVDARVAVALRARSARRLGDRVAADGDDPGPQAAVAAWPHAACRRVAFDPDRLAGLVSRRRER